jgi:hypothetical protein
MTTQLNRSPVLLHAAASLPLLQGAAWRRAGHALWQSFEAFGRARAASELERLAVLRAGIDPELGQQLRQAAKDLA